MTLTGRMSRCPRHQRAKKIIDLEKHAVIQMTQALEALGDHYAVSGFSGYGRDQVEYTVCKRFTDSLDATVKAKIGGLKACRSYADGSGDSACGQAVVPNRSSN
jgi:nitric oxide reductase activation protein